MQSKNKTILNNSKALHRGTTFIYLFCSWSVSSNYFAAKSVFVGESKRQSLTTTTTLATAATSTATAATANR
jgi:hypothetical protein